MPKEAETIKGDLGFVFVSCSNTVCHSRTICAVHETATEKRLGHPDVRVDVLEGKIRLSCLHCEEPFVPEPDESAGEKES